ncbi:MAG: hypothetical protein EHM56_13745, partial [Chloroflexi bacterium]
MTEESPCSQGSPTPWTEAGAASGSGQRGPGRLQGCVRDAQHQEREAGTGHQGQQRARVRLLRRAHGRGGEGRCLGILQGHDLLPGEG